MSAVFDLLSKPSPAESKLLERYEAFPSDPRRERTFEAFAKSGLPGRRHESWRWSDLRSALDKFSPEPSELKFEDPFISIEDGVKIVLSDEGISVEGKLPQGLRIVEQEIAMALGGAEDMPMAALAASLANAPANFMVDVSENQDAPIHIINNTRAPSAFARLSFLIRADVNAQIIERHISPNGFSNLVIEYTTEPRAKLDRIVYQRGSKCSLQIVTAIVQLADESEFAQTGLAFGAQLCRLETRVFHQGVNTKARLNTAYLAGDGFHIDNTSFVRHSKEGGVTRQVCKGAVKDGGTGVFQGKFFVARKGQQTDAEMAHNAILLEDGAEVFAKPELEIYADDVQCAHGNTSGSLDQNALFYMRQRGISVQEAKALLTRAFIGEAFDDLESEELQECLIEEAGEWLTANL